MRLEEVKSGYVLEVIDKRTNKVVVKGNVFGISESEYTDNLSILLDTGYEIVIRKR